MKLLYKRGEDLGKDLDRPTTRDASANDRVGSSALRGLRNGVYRHTLALGKPDRSLRRSPRSVERDRSLGALHHLVALLLIRCEVTHHEGQSAQGIENLDLSIRKMSLCKGPLCTLQQL